MTSAPVLRGIPERIGPIPSALFVPGNTGVMETPYGPLKYDFRDDLFWLCYGDPEHWDSYHDLPHMSARIADHRGQEAITLSVRSVLKDGCAASQFGLQKSGRHPGIYGAQLVSAAIAYMDHHRPQPPSYLRGSWEEGDSINLATYRNVMSARTDLDPEARKRVAALSTWTGGLAIAHGFTEVEHVEETGKIFPIVYAFFKRPGRPAQP